MFVLYASILTVTGSLLGFILLLVFVAKIIVGKDSQKLSRVSNGFQIHLLHDSLIHCIAISNLLMGYIVVLIC